MASPLRRIWIAPVAFLVLDIPVFAVNVKLGVLVLVDLAPGIDSILLLVDVAAATSRAVLFDVPPAVAVGYYLM